MKNGKYITDGGIEEWYLNNEWHRENGPARQSGGYKSWWINGKRHREDGHAIEYQNGNKEWYLNDELLDCDTQEKFERLMKLKAFW